MYRICEIYKCIHLDNQPTFHNFYCYFCETTTIYVPVYDATWTDGIAFFFFALLTCGGNKYITKGRQSDLNNYSHFERRRLQEYIMHHVIRYVIKMLLVKRLINGGPNEFYL